MCELKALLLKHLADGGGRNEKLNALGNIKDETVDCRIKDFLKIIMIKNAMAKIDK